MLRRLSWSEHTDEEVCSRVSVVIKDLHRLGPAGTAEVLDIVKNSEAFPPSVTFQVHDGGRTWTDDEPSVQFVEITSSDSRLIGDLGNTEVTSNSDYLQPSSSVGLFFDIANVFKDYIPWL